MKKLVAVALFACVCAGLVSANAPEASSKDSSVVEALKQNAQDHGDALVAADSTDSIRSSPTTGWPSGSPGGL